MEELKDLIRGLIVEVQGLRQDVISITSSINNLDNIYEAINQLGDTITGPLNYNLQDIHATLETIDQSIVTNGT